MKLAKNIAHLRKLKGYTQEEFADEFKIKKSRLGAWEENRAFPPVDMLLTMSDFFRLPIDILVRYDLTKAESIPSINIGGQRILFPVQVDAKNNDNIEMVTLKASAGYLNGYQDPEFIEDLPRIGLPFLRTGKMRAFPIKGDSMLPLKDGSFVIGKFVEDKTDLRKGHTYVVLTREDGLVYKRVYPDKNGKILHLHSDNPKYEPYSVPMRDVLELWEFSCSINTKEFEKDEAPDMGKMMDILQVVKNELSEMKRKK
jgi:transcriptional regulator with XRE-family HTH domain